MSDPPGDDFSEYMADFTPEERQAFQAKVTKFDPKRKRTKKAPPPPPPPPGGWPDWHQLLIRDEKGRIYANVENALTALRHAAVFRNAFIFDEMRQDAVLMQTLPAPEDATPSSDPPRVVNDDDVTRAQAWLQRNGFPLIGKEIVGQAIEAFARERRVHPVRDWLEGLVWDGVSRIDRWLFTYLGAKAEDDASIEYVRMIGKMFLIAMVARVFQPGCQCDYMLVLEGPQGALKSTACRALAGDWFTDSLPSSVTSKDARQHLRGKWVIEIKELASFKKAETEDLKSFIDRRDEEYRPPYAKRNVVERRQCVLVGTTNEDVYIKDDSGGRRYWPVIVTLILIEALLEDRAQLFAEALIAYRRGERWWPTQADEDRYFKPQQERRQDQDAWLPTISHWLQSQIEQRFTVSMIARGCLGFDGEARIGRVEQNRIVNVLRELKWIQQRTERGRFYIPPAPADDE